MNLRRLPFNNLARHLGRSAGLALLVALLAFTALGGTLMVSSLSTGLSSLEARLGADVIVVPDSAKSTADLESIVLEGTPGYFYMDKGYVEKVASVPGVGKVSPQYYLATVKAGCCSMPVQVIGIDPATDFAIQPWIARSYADELGAGEVVVGCNITGAVGSAIMLYGVECPIVAKLDETGTALDNAVFANADTVKQLIAASETQGLAVLAGYDPDQIVSTVQVKVADGAQVQNVVDYINLHVRGATAVRAKAMISGVADSMAGVSGVITALVAVAWVLAAAVLVVAFWMLGRQRVREFAVLRVVGASRGDLTRIVVVESAVISAVGALVGAVLAVAGIVGFNGLLETTLGVPFLMPDVGTVALCALLAFAVSLVCGCAASAVAARRLSRVDTGQILREG